MVQGIRHFWKRVILFWTPVIIFTANKECHFMSTISPEIYRSARVFVTIYSMYGMFCRSLGTLPNPFFCEIEKAV
jgi:hypothetical protein